MSSTVSEPTDSAPRSIPLPLLNTEQRWEEYTDTQHDVWATLYSRRMETLESTGSEVFLNGARTIGLNERQIPKLADVNAKLGPRTGWAAVPVGGFIEASGFFGALAAKRFPTTVTIRPPDSLNYIPEPDIFHDVFGHVPLHADPVFADFLQQFGAAASLAVGPDDIQRMARLFWFTVEFGLIQEKGEVKVYGSGLISSAADAANALGGKCDIRPFSLDAVFNQSFDIDHVQDVLFVVDSFDQLFEAVDRAAEIVRA